MKIDFKNIYFYFGKTSFNFQNKKKIFGIVSNTENVVLKCSRRNKSSFEVTYIKDSLVKTRLI